MKLWRALIALLVPLGTYAGTMDGAVLPLSLPITTRDQIVSLVEKEIGRFWVIVRFPDLPGNVFLEKEKIYTPADGRLADLIKSEIYFLMKSQLKPEYMGERALLSVCVNYKRDGLSAPTAPEVFEFYVEFRNREVVVPYDDFCKTQYTSWCPAPYLPAWGVPRVTNIDYVYQDGASEYRFSSEQGLKGLISAPYLHVFYLDPLHDSKLNYCKPRHQLKKVTFWTNPDTFESIEYDGVTGKLLPKDAITVYGLKDRSLQVYGKPQTSIDVEYSTNLVDWQKAKKVELDFYGSGLADVSTFRDPITGNAFFRAAYSTE